jgi:hypothetical protein
MGVTSSQASSEATIPATWAKWSVRVWSFEVLSELPSIIQAGMDAEVGIGRIAQFSETVYFARSTELSRFIEPIHFTASRRLRPLVSSRLSREVLATDADKPRSFGRPQRNSVLCERDAQRAG